MSQPIQIFWTCADLDEARRISRALVEKRLVACANIIPRIESVFLWEGEIATETEVKVIFKTLEEKFEAVKQEILAQASYDVPEILKINISGGNDTYLDWLVEVVRT